MSTATKTRPDASNTNDGECCSYAEVRKAAGSKSLERLQEALIATGWTTAASLDDPPTVGKTALQMAAWKGGMDNVKYLVETVGCNVNVYAKEAYSYGKTPIFFAATQSRMDVVEYLLDNGAKVTIVNNKGQSPLSLAASHCATPALLRRIQEQQLAEEEAYRQSLHEFPLPYSIPMDTKITETGWWNFRASHSDGLAYGDLAVGFLDRPLIDTDTVTEYAINPTTRKSRKGAFAKRNPKAAKARLEAREGANGFKRIPQEKQSQTDKVTGTTADEDNAFQAAWLHLEKYFMASTQQNGNQNIAHKDVTALLTIIAWYDKKRRQWIPETVQRLGVEFDHETGSTARSDRAEKLIQTSLAQLASKCSEDSSQALETSADDVEWIAIDIDDTRLTKLLHKLLRRIHPPVECSDEIPSPPPGANKKSSATSKPMLQRMKELDNILHSDLYRDAIKVVSSLDISKQLMPPQQPALALQLPHLPIWVDSFGLVDSLLVQLQNRTNTLTDSSSSIPVVGIDTEWYDAPMHPKEVSSRKTSPELATLQLSFVDPQCPTRLCTYVIDLIKASDDKNGKFFSRVKDLIQYIMTEPKLLILGFAMGHDVKMLTAYIGHNELRPASMLDIQQLLYYQHEPMAKTFPAINGQKGQLPGLKACVAQYCDVLPLSKDEQCSEWASRPLTDAQLHYAGLDAAILLYLVSHYQRRLIND